MAFCPQCGANVPDGTPVCPQCGRAIEREYMKYCSSCGQKLSWKGFEFIEVTYK